MRALLIASLFVLVACKDPGTAADMADLGLCGVQACTCVQGKSCVLLPTFVPFCADDCADDRDCSDGDACVALLRGSGFLTKACVKAERFAQCSMPNSCDAGMATSCSGDTLITGETIAAGVCGRSYVHCDNGCTGGGDAGTPAMCRP